MCRFGVQCLMGSIACETCGICIMMIAIRHRAHDRCDRVGRRCECTVIHLARLSERFFVSGLNRWVIPNHTEMLYWTMVEQTTIFIAICTVLHNHLIFRPLFFAKPFSVCLRAVFGYWKWLCPLLLLRVFVLN